MDCLSLNLQALVYLAISASLIHTSPHWSSGQLVCLSVSTSEKFTEARGSIPLCGVFFVRDHYPLASGVVFCPFAYVLSPL